MTDIEMKLVELDAMLDELSAAVGHATTECKEAADELEQDSDRLVAFVRRRRHTAASASSAKPTALALEIVQRARRVRLVGDRKQLERAVRWARFRMWLRGRWDRLWRGRKDARR